MSRHKKHPPHEEHADETWLIPYADLLTLLLALFIVLFASSQVDQKKLSAMAASMGYAFNSPLSGAPPGTFAIMPSIGGESGHDAATSEAGQLAALKRKLDLYILENNLNTELDAKMTDQGLLIRIRDSALFDSGSADLRSDAQKISAKIADLLGSVEQSILISGHTDNVPINTARFPSNWDLSSQRALNVMKFILATNSKLKPERFSAIGHSEYRPLAPNDNEQNRAKNRRVEVLVQRKYMEGSNNNNMTVPVNINPNAGNKADLGAKPTKPDGK